MERKIEVVCKELIRPLSPTPDHLRFFNLSYLDQMAFTIYAPLALFYPSENDESYYSSFEQARAVNSSRLLVLKKSLSQILASFYPFAGRVKDNSIECNDDGVPFYEAFARNYRLEDVVRKAELDEHFLPTGEEAKSGSALYPLLVQVTFFECGGMVIGLRASHKLSDCASFCTIVSIWAATAAQGSPVPDLVAASKFLPPPIPYVPPKPIVSEIMKVFYGKKRDTKIFTFNPSTIASLKAEAMSDAVPTPTRVETVSALIWKCSISASDHASGQTRRMAQNVNIRKRLVPPLPNDSIGNVVASATACKSEKDSSHLSTLVSCIRKSLLELNSKYVDPKSKEEAILGIPYDHFEVTAGEFGGEIELHISSVCGYKFYDIDFGWGKPTWVSLIQDFGLNFVYLMDSREGGGIDAWVCLKDKMSMSYFEHELQRSTIGNGH